ncbi:hypothetical protein ABZ907_01315 [Nonomuraea wenchangensis]
MPRSGPSRQEAPAALRPERTALRWIGQGLAPGRVVAYTRSCCMTAYELVACGGVYQIRRQTLPRWGVPPVSWTAERWRRGEALEWCACSPVRHDEPPRRPVERG